VVKDRAENPVNEREPLDVHDMGVAGISIVEEAHKKTLAIAREAIRLLERFVEGYPPKNQSKCRKKECKYCDTHALLARSDVQAIKESQEISVAENPKEGK